MNKKNQEVGKIEPKQFLEKFCFEYDKRKRTRRGEKDSSEMGWGGVES